MSVPVLLVVGLVAVPFVAALFVGAAARGRSEMPAAERIPIRRWTPADAFRNAAAGTCLIVHRQQRLWDRELDELQPWRRPDLRRPDLPHP